MWLMISAIISMLWIIPTGQVTSPGLGDDPTTFDRQIDLANLKRDVAFLNAVVAEDARFTHFGGTVWTKQQWLDATKSYAGLERNVDAVEVERHGDVVETTGHIQVKTPNTQRPEYQIYYVRLYARRDGHWQFLSHRTMRQVDGPMPSAPGPVARPGLGVGAGVAVGLGGTQQGDGAFRPGNGGLRLAYSASLMSFFRQRGMKAPIRGSISPSAGSRS
jgi:hypothetical protein